MLYHTLGFKHYIGYLFQASVVDGLSELRKEESREYYKLIYIKTGPCHFLLNGKEFILTGACAICMNEKDQIIFYDVNEASAKMLLFQPSVINSTLTFDRIRNSNKLLSSTEYQDLYYLKQFIPDEKTSMKILSLYTIDATMIENKLQLIKEGLQLQESIFWPCRSRAYLFEILFCLARQEEDEQMASNFVINEGKSRLAFDVIYYLQSCYHQKITIEKLSDEFHTNRTTLLNDFKKYTGQSINNYLIQLRLMMASTLLRDTDLPADEICERTGFRDISYFSKVFKKKLNYTPSEYRRICKEKSVV